LAGRAPRPAPKDLTVEAGTPAARAAARGMSSERVAAVASRVEKLAVKMAEPAPPPATAPAVLTREIVVKALSSEDPTRPAREPQVAATPVEAGPTEATSATADRTVAAQRQADEIMRSGVLTADAAKALSFQLDTLPRAEAFEIRRRLADAINKQELVPAELPFDMP
jgi:hypothetical protein